MKTKTLLLTVLLGFAPAIYADSPSSVAARNGVKPSTVDSNGGFDFTARDKGEHKGWCKGQGHLSAPGKKGSGHRNHSHCNDDGDDDDDGGGGGPLQCPEFQIYDPISGQCLPLG